MVTTAFDEISVEDCFFPLSSRTEFVTEITEGHKTPNSWVGRGFNWDRKIPVQNFTLKHGFKPGLLISQVNTVTTRLLAVLGFPLLPGFL